LPAANDQTRCQADDTDVDPKWPQQNASCPAIDTSKQWPSRLRWTGRVRARRIDPASGIDVDPLLHKRSPLPRAATKSPLRRRGRPCLLRWVSGSQARARFADATQAAASTRRLRSRSHRLPVGAAASSAALHAGASSSGMSNQRGRS
jgi:hypothetical protein